MANKLAGLLEEDDSPEAAGHVEQNVNPKPRSASSSTSSGSVPIPTRVPWRSRLAASMGYAQWGRILQVLTRRFGAQGPLALSRGQRVLYIRGSCRVCWCELARLQADGLGPSKASVVSGRRRLGAIGP